MFSNRKWKMVLMGLGLMGGASLQAEDASVRIRNPKGYKQSIFEHWRESQNVGAKPKPNSAGAPTTVPTTSSIVKASNPREESTRVVADEQKVYLQRLEVCTKLREAAIETGNDELLRQADELEMQATDVYRRKISALPGAASLTMERLERKLGGTASPLDSDSKRDLSSPATAKASRKGEKQ